MEWQEWKYWKLYQVVEHLRDEVSDVVGALPTGNDIEDVAYELDYALDGLNDALHALDRLWETSSAFNGGN